MLPLVCKARAPRIPRHFRREAGDCEADSQDLQPSNAGVALSIPNACGPLGRVHLWNL